MKSGLRFIILLFLTVNLYFLSCKKEYSCEGCKPDKSNKPPIAIASPDQVITLPVDSAMLDGSASSDPDGVIKEWLWTKISGPSTCTVLSPTDSMSKVKSLIPGSYQFELKVTDNDRLSSRDTVRVIVDSNVKTNHPPVAVAGPDQTITLPANSITLNAGGSTDPDNNIASYKWAKISGPSSFDIANSNAIQTQVNNLVQGNYQFELIVTDLGGYFSKDTMSVMVNQVDPLPTACNRPILAAQLVPIGTLTEGRFGLVTASAGNKILFAGGFAQTSYSTRVDIFDALNNSWSIAELSIGRQGMAVASVGNKIFFAGGGWPDYAGSTSRVDIYDVSTNTWSTAELSEPRLELAAATIGEKIFFAGGYNFIGRSTRVDIYNNADNTWSTAELSEARNGLTAVAAGNKAYFAGGFSDVGGLHRSAKIDIYDALNGSWTTSSLGNGRAFFAGIVRANKIYWAGGINWSSPSGNPESNHVEVLDISTGSTSFNCLIPKTQFGTVHKDDNIVFFTGYPGEGRKFDIYNLTTDTWSTGVLNQSLNDAAIISLNNIIYVAGGTNNGNGYYNGVWRLDF